jgi:hypothetical protein
MSFGSSQNNQQKIATNDLNAGAAQGLDTGKLASGTGFGLINQAGSELNAPANYYSSILQGGSAADAALAPDINRTRAAADQTRGAEETLAPRGGGRGSSLFTTPSNTNQQVQSIFNTARPMAAEGATKVAGVTGGLGTSALGTGANYLGQGVSAADSGFKAGTQQYQQQQQSGAGIGQMAGGIAQALMLAYA